MLFNSFVFAIFLPLVFIFYWFVFNKNLRLQNVFLIVVSYIFYGWWDWRFLSLIIFSTLLDYTLGLIIQNQQNDRKRKILIFISLFVNLGFLGFFKYFNFFIDSFISAFGSIGVNLQARSLNIILPVGISFYTFQTLSYTLDVYKRKLVATKDFASFVAFVCFFPQLVAGPIERATNLLPQFYKKRTFNYEHAVDGMRQMLWGFFKKIVIADGCAVYVNDIFNNYHQYSGITLILGIILFAFQIYCDFSGYSDIAIGTARLFGFSLMRNFAFPYLSRDIAEFWRRWHISLSTWFRDYVYIPLGGSRGGMKMKIRNTFIIFVVSGFWHGANWTFIIWGALNALYFLPLLLLKKNRVNTDVVAENKVLPTIKEFFQILFTFTITCIAWVFFRANSVSDAFLYIKKMFLFNNTGHNYKFGIDIFIFLILLIIIEWRSRKLHHGLEVLPSNRIARYMIYCLLCYISIAYFNVSNQSFIYFQF